VVAVKAAAARAMAVSFLIMALLLVEVDGATLFKPPTAINYRNAKPFFP
jgi:NADH:ubiquinone oxidoreductase subunit 3 (subunit A)